MQEQDFDIELTLGGTLYRFSVYPHWQEERQASIFTIGLDGVDVGQIGLNENNLWEWLNEGLTDVDADRIGDLIESHYK